LGVLGCSLVQFVVRVVGFS